MNYFVSHHLPKSKSSCYDGTHNENTEVYQTAVWKAHTQEKTSIACEEFGKDASNGKGQSYLH
jgi:hypothetical protein